MLKYVAPLAVLVVLALSVFAGTASATSYGFAGYQIGPGACVGCEVQAYNLNTKGQGSTITNGSGTYSFSLVPNNTYEFRIWTCKVHSRYATAWSGPVSGSSTALPSLYANSGYGAC